MSTFRVIFRRLGPRRSILLGLAIIVAPTVNAWWGLFFKEPMVPTLIDKVGEGNITVGQVLIVALPVGALLTIGVFLYSALKPTQPFVPDLAVSTQRFGDVVAFMLRIDNGVPDIFHGCYAQIIEFVRISGPVSSTDLPQKGQRLIWSAYEERKRESVTMTSLSGEHLLLAQFDKRTPSAFQIPIGLSTVRTVERSGSYRATIEVGSDQSATTPSVFQFTISTEGEDISEENGIRISQINLVTA